MSTRLPDSDSRSKMLALLNLSNVPRFVVTPHTKPQSVADHSFRTAIIALELAQRTYSAMVDKAVMLRFALTHDIAESGSGDIPAPFKDAMRKELSAHKLEHLIPMMEERVCPWIADEFDILQDATASEEGADTFHIVKIADMVEAMTYIQKWGVGYRARDARDWIAERINQYIANRIDTFRGEHFSKAYREVSDALLLD